MCNEKKLKKLLSSKGKEHSVPAFLIFIELFMFSKSDLYNRYIVLALNFTWLIKSSVYTTALFDSNTNG